MTLSIGSLEWCPSTPGTLSKCYWNGVQVFLESCSSVSRNAVQVLLESVSKCYRNTHALGLAFHEVEHGLNHPCGGEDLPVVGDALFRFNETHSFLRR